MIHHLIRSGLTLSHIVDMYYNPQWGVVASQGIGTSKKLNSCVRYDNYYSDIDQVKLRQEAFVFGTELRSILVIPVSDDALSAAIALTIERLNNEIRYGCSTEFETGIRKIASPFAYFSLLDSSLDSFGPCTEQRKRPDDAEDSEYEGNPIDVRFPSSGIADVGIIWDTSIYAFRDTYYLKQVRRDVWMKDLAFKIYVPIMTIQIIRLYWVDLEFGFSLSAFCPLLLGQMGNWQKWLQSDTSG